MVCVAAVATSSATYAWFVSNNSVKATTTNISAQSNSAYLVIDNAAAGATKNTSTSSATASENNSKALYPAQWKNGFDAAGKKSGEEGFTTATYQFESAYASDKTKADEKTGTRFAVGAPSKAVTDEYALLNTFYVGTGTYDGEFKDLKISDMTVTADAEQSLKTAMRLLIMTYAPKAGSDAAPTAWAVAKYDGSKLVIESQSITATASEDVSGVIYQDQFGKTEGDVKVEVYAYYDGADTQVYTTNLDKLTAIGATVTFDATPTEYGK